MAILVVINEYMGTECDRLSTADEHTGLEKDAGMGILSIAKVFF
jgi:hypothetical protein